MATSLESAVSVVPGRFPRHRISDGAKEVRRFNQLFENVRFDGQRKAIVKHFIEKLPPRVDRGAHNEADYTSSSHIT